MLFTDLAICCVLTYPSDTCSCTSASHNYWQMSSSIR